MSINNINNLQNLANSVNQAGSNAVSNNQASNALSKRDMDLFNPDTGLKTLITPGDPVVQFGPHATQDDMADAIVNPIRSILS